MSVELLTLDNPLLSSPKNGDLAHFSAVDCTELSEEVTALIRNGMSKATKKAYQSDLKHFLAVGGTIPSTGSEIAQYIAAQADISSIATIQRRLASIAKVHRSRGHISPTTDELARATLRGLKRMKGVAQRQATPLLINDLFSLLDKTGDNILDVRDRALLLLGFAGGFRRSELVGLDCSDLVQTRQGVEITIRQSKSDQGGFGRKIGIPFGRGRWCPVIALSEWLAASSIQDGPIFRPINRHSRLGSSRISDAAVCSIIRRRVNAAGINPSRYSGHSLRSGFATSAAQAGVSSWSIRKQTGHASEATLSRYIRDGQLFSHNAAAVLL